MVKLLKEAVHITYVLPPLCQSNLCPLGSMRNWAVLWISVLRGRFMEIIKLGNASILSAGRGGGVFENNLWRANYSNGLPQSNRVIRTCSNFWIRGCQLFLQLIAFYVRNSAVIQWWNLLLVRGWFSVQRANCVNSSYLFIIALVDHITIHHLIKARLHGGWCGQIKHVIISARKCRLSIIQYFDILFSHNPSP